MERGAAAVVTDSAEVYAEIGGAGAAGGAGRAWRRALSEVSRR